MRLNRMYMYTVSDTVYRNTCTCNYESNQRVGK